MADIEMPDASSSASAKPRASGPTKSLKSAAAADNGSDGKKRFEVKKWNAVALWAWDIVASSVKQIKHQLRAKSAQWLGVFAMYAFLTGIDSGQNDNECTACFSLPLHLALAEDSSSLSIRQQRLGISEIWSVMPYRMGLRIPGKRASYENIT
ncbi:RING-box protein 1 [Sticta canariensis]|nr:RING-box protein 1 [Sticta canariensis]